MQHRDLNSEMVMAEMPRTEEELYHMAAQVEIDMRALDAGEDWREELLELVMDLRRYLRPTSPLDDDTRDALMPELKTMVIAIKASMKSDRKVDREARQREARLLAFRDRLLRLVRAAFPGSGLEEIELEEYRERARGAAETLARRLEILDQVRVKPDEAAKVAREYMDLFLFWQILDRGSTPEERTASEEAFIGFRSVMARSENYFEQRDRVIFRWEDPVAFSPDVVAIREELRQMLKSAGAPVDEAEEGEGTK